MSGFQPPRPPEPAAPRITVQEDTFKRRLLPRDWRDWALAALLRACAAFGFLLAPTVEARAGDAALALVCVLAAGGFAAVVGYRWYTTRQPLRVELIADAIALVVLVPALALAAGIQAADSRFGGRDENVVAATIATLLIFLIVTVIARAVDSERGRQVAIALLAAGLTVAATVGGGDRFASGEYWKGAALAWFVAGFTTLIYGLMPRSAGVIVLSGVYAVFAIVVLLTRETQTGFQDAKDSTGLVPVATLLVVGGIIALAAFFAGRPPRRPRGAPVPTPAQYERFAEGDRRDSRQDTDRWH